MALKVVLVLFLLLVVVVVLVVLVLVLVVVLVLALVLLFSVGVGVGVGVGVVGTNKDCGPQNKVLELILEFAWCPLKVSLEFCTVLKKTFGADFWLFFRFVKACWAPFWTFLAPKSCRKGSSRFALYQYDFSGCPNLAKRGPAACSLGVP